MESTPLHCDINIGINIIIMKHNKLNNIINNAACLFPYDHYQELTYIS